MAFSPSWRTDTALALAVQMYEGREFSAAPILADALQDAGCDSADVLDHLRDPRNLSGVSPADAPDLGLPVAGGRRWLPGCPGWRRPSR